ncbi:MAG: winged helix-turn-helix domain-containing protein [Acidimicrobiia bacterium]
MALVAQGFGAPRPTGRTDVRHARKGLAAVGLIQIDSVNVLARSHELPLFSRLGPHPRDLIPDLAYRRRELFEYWAHEASLVPVALHPFLRWRMARAAGEAWGRMRGIQQDQPALVKAVVDEVAARGPLPARELDNPPGARRSGGPWWGWGDVKTALEWLFWSGELAAAGRTRSFERIYDLTERVLPADVLAVPTPAEPDAQRELLRFAAARLGVGTAGDVADYFRIRRPEAAPRLAELVEEGVLAPVQVEGWPKPGFLDPAAAATRRRRPRPRALLSPFDSLVWERSRVERLFGMRLRLEVYTPAERRIHGYYVLPFLLGEHLVARVDLKADRQSSVLRVLGAHGEPPHDPAVTAPALAAELDDLARFLGLERVGVERRGDLAVLLAG